MSGYANGETLRLSLWLDNDEGYYRIVQRLARLSDSAEELATELKEWFGEIATDEMRKDIGDLDEIDWVEFAETALAE